MKQILIGGFNGVLDTFQEEDLQIILDKETDGKKLLVDLKVNQSK